MKTVFITSSESSVPRLLLRGGFLGGLSRRGAKVVLLVSPQEEEEYEKEFGAVATVVGVPPLRASVRRESIISFIARNAHPSRTIRWVHKEQYFFDGNVLRLFSRCLVRFCLGFLPFTPALIRVFDLLFIRFDPAVGRIFDEYHPDAVLSTMLFRENDIRVAREARRRRIPLAGMVRSWDNLTTYGYIRTIPDTFVAQSEFIADMARRYQRFPAETIKISGTPLYDLYAGKEILWSREKFLSRYGFPADAKIVLYGAMGTFLFSKENEMISVLERLAEKYAGRLYCIFRAHPSFPVEPDVMRRSRRIFIEQPGTEVKGSRENLKERRRMLRGDEEIYINTLYHADVIVTAASSVSVDAILFDRPVITIDFDPSIPPAGCRSVRGFHKYFTHLREAMKCRGMWKVESEEELEQAVGAYLKKRRNESFTASSISVKSAIAWNER